jgi:hypothetical protein
LTGKGWGEEFLSSSSSIQVLMDASTAPLYSLVRIGRRSSSMPIIVKIKERMLAACKVVDKANG